MKREFLETLLKDLNPSSEVIDKIMKENGNDIEGAKAKYADYDDLKAQLEKANATMEKFKDYDQVKSDVEKYKAEAKKAQEESAAKIARLELQSKIKDFTGGKKFVNDFTRDAINAQLEAALGKDESKGKSLDDLFKEITDGKADILKDENKPTPPTEIPMSGGHDKNADAVAKARQVMGLPPLGKQE